MFFAVVSFYSNAQSPISSTILQTPGNLRQQRTISGLVYGFTSESSLAFPLPGAQVKQLNTTNGAIVGNDGIYYLTLNPANGNQIEASCIGFKSQKQTVGSAQYYNFILEEDTVD